MSAEDTALLDAMQSFIEAGHDFKFGINNDGTVRANIYGLTGSRSAAQVGVRAALQDLLAQVVAARLAGAPAPSPVSGWNPYKAIVDEAGAGRPKPK